MKQIFAKLKGHKPYHIRLFKEETEANLDFFKLPEIAEKIAYAPFHKDLKKTDWYFVEIDSQQKEDMLDTYLEAVRSEPHLADQADYANIETIYRNVGGKLIFSRVTNGMRIGELDQNLLTFEENGVKIVSPQFAIDFSGQVDVMFDGSNKLFFKSFARAKMIFKGLDVFYQDASRDEKETFLENDLFSVGEINPDFIGPRAAIQISEILSNPKLDLDDNEISLKIVNYANQYPSSGVKVDDEGQIIINNKADLNATLKLLSQKFFTSAITDEKFEANRVEKLTN